MNITNIGDTNQAMQQNIRRNIQNSNGGLPHIESTPMPINDYSMQDDQSMNNLLNHIGLEIQRRGGN